MVDIVAIHTWAAYVVCGLSSRGGILFNNIPYYCSAAIQNVDIDTVMNVTPTIHQVLMLIKTTIYRKQDNNIYINTNSMHISLIYLYIM